MGSKIKKSQKNSEQTIGFVSLGCAKNTVDSEKMLALIVQAGYLLSYDIEIADVVVVNTCGFIAPAKEEALEIINEAISYKNAEKVKKVIVAGCLSERMGKELLKEAPGIDAIVGLGQRDKIAEIISQLLNGKTEKLYLSGDNWTSKIQDDKDRLLINPPHWAYLRISEGCDRRCSFCTIPIIKGRFRSKPAEDVLAEAKQLVEAGAVELSIIAQDSNYYGKDVGIENGLAKLLGKLEKIEKLKWIRLMYLYPANINEELIETIAQSEKVVNYIDMPIQHINNKILRDMHRIDTKEKTVRLIEKLRKAMPDVILRTTVIAGFAGETEDQFAELIEFVKWAKFDALGCFTYWPEKGTKAAELNGQLPQTVKEQRGKEIMLAQQKIAFAKNKARIGQKIVCLIDEKTTKNTASGRFYGQGPQIDSLCLIKKCRQKTGNFVKAQVVGTKDYDLIVEAR